jgi:pSer/pThr/pTyr-binding forkhead associated (FHA) protein
LNNARLVATSGYLKGTVWALENGPLFMGRDASNQVEVSDPAVSRKHCSLSTLSSGAFEIADLDSHNGTSVNGTKVSRRTIGHGDRIRIGSSEYVFLTGPDDAAMPSGNTLTDTGLLTVHLDVSGLPSDASGVGRMARDLSAFFKIANVINSTRDVQALQRELLVLISEVIPAAEAAIVLQATRNDLPRPLCTWNRKGLTQTEMIIREEPVQQAIWERCAVFSAASGDAATEHVLCVPLVAVERILGVIYLSSPTTSAAFTEEHAYFLSSISRIAAVTLENL